MNDLILQVKNLTVYLKKSKKCILSDVCFELKKGDVLGIDGKNGCGKTTLLKIIYGLTNDYDIKSGEIYFYPFSNKNILSFNQRELLEYRQSIAYVKQKDDYDGLNKLNILDLIEDAISDIKGAELNRYVELFNVCFPQTKDQSITLKSKPNNLSGGEQRMLSIFLGLVCRKQSNLMIIDEPLNNLDFENVMKISDLINEIKINNPWAAILMITHCKIITCINRQRKIVDGKMECKDSKYECHHCMGEPDCENFYLKRKNNLTTLRTDTKFTKMF